VSNYRYGDVNTDSIKGTFRRCYDCGVNVGSTNWNAHMKKHISRPNDDYYTRDEVQAIIGCTKGVLNNEIRYGRLPIIKTPGQRRQWVSKEALLKYAEEKMRNGDLRMMSSVTRAIDGRNKQNSY
jgi:hypothetical protein